MLDWTALNPAQAMAANLFYRHRKLLLCFPRQIGKTELGVRLLEDITSRPFTSSSLFIAKSYASQKKATREKFMRLFAKQQFEVNTDLVYNKQFPTSAIFMGSADKSPDSQRGGTYSMIHGSEVAFWKVESGESLTGFLGKVIQPTTAKTGGYIFLESTNNGKNGWYDLWEDYKNWGFFRLKLTLTDLLYLGLVTQEYYDYIKKTTPPDIFKQEYECEFITFLGKAYAEFDIHQHVEDIPGPLRWQKSVLAIDWGYHPSATCVLFGYVSDGVLCVYDEHYQHKERTDDTKLAIESRLYNFTVDEFAAVADHEQDRIDELNLAGITCGKAKKQNVLGARTQIKTMLWNNKIKIHPRCKFLIRDLEAACWDDKHDGEIDYSQCTWGHFDAEAALRYLVRELGQFEVKKPIENPHSDESSAREWALRQGLTA
jgi:terminase large subunit-like protein